MDVLLCCAHHFSYPLSTSWNQKKTVNAGYRPSSTCGNSAEKFKKKILLKIKLKKSKFKHSALDTAGKLFLYLGTTKKCVLLNDGTGC